MMKNYILFQVKHKPELSGLCQFLILALLLTVFSFCSACDNNTIDIDDENISTDGEAVDSTDASVVILDETEIVDYNKFYKPSDLSDIDMLRSDSKWSFTRSKQSEHFIVFWEKGFGNDPNAANVPEEMKVDIDDLLQKVETFFEMNVNTLKFAELGSGKSNLDKYKMQIYLLYQSEWLATGAGYDDMIGALWVNPGTCKPVGSTIAHEIGHSFQYQVYADLLATGEIANDFTRGFRYGFGGNGGNGFWEQCAQWQSFQSYPAEAFSSYNFGVYMKNYHRHFGHEWQRYASYWLHYYWAEKHGIDFLGKLWREAKKPEDPLQAYMRINGLSVDELNAELYDAVSHLVTWDIDAIRSYGEDYIGKYTYSLFQLDDGSYQVAYNACPGTSGYNVIPLNVPVSGTVVSVAFTGLDPGTVLAANDPGEYTDNETKFTKRTYNSNSNAKAGWRYGYVALLKNGQRVYSQMNEASSAVVEFTIPEECKNLWLVVLGAPAAYSAHAWDEKESNDDQWPYKVKFTNTDLLGNITINPEDKPSDLSLSYDISFPAQASAYTGTTVNLNNNGDITKVAQALVMQPSVIATSLLAAKASPQEGKIAFAAIEPDGSLNYNTTANDLGFWFDSSGATINWAQDNDSKIYTQFNPGNFEFEIGQFPGKCKPGNQFVVKNALVYTFEGKQYQIKLTFNITIQ